MTALEGKIILPGEQRRVGTHPVKNQSAATHTVKNISRKSRVNRFKPSIIQHQIMNILWEAGQPIGDKIGHLPRTGDIIEALGLPRTNSSYASVSRSLTRLERKGRIVGYYPSIATPGKGRHWGVKP